MIPGLVDAIIAVESAGKAEAVSPKGAQGLMQLMPDTGREWHARLGLPGTYEPFNKEQNKIIGTAYIGWCIKQFGGDVELGAAAYNWGIGHVQRKLHELSASTWAEIKHEAPPETVKYVKAVTQRLDRAAA